LLYADKIDVDNIYADKMDSDKIDTGNIDADKMDTDKIEAWKIKRPLAKLEHLKEMYTSKIIKTQKITEEIKKSKIPHE
ncbi:41619_t:CDS:1, partial [Gigaspora margarita]